MPQAVEKIRSPATSVRPRLIPVLLLKHGTIVRSQLFRVHQVIGNPMSTVQRFSDWNVDELIVLDISRGEQGYDLRRDDLQQQYAGNTAFDVLCEIANVCFMPLTFGGRIRSLKDIENRLARWVLDESDGVPVDIANDFALDTTLEQEPPTGGLEHLGEGRRVLAVGLRAAAGFEAQEVDHDDRPFDVGEQLGEGVVLGANRCAHFFLMIHMLLSP